MFQGEILAFYCTFVSLGHIYLPVLKVLAPVVERLDNAIHRINRYPLSVDKTNHAIHRIVICPEDSVIHFSNHLQSAEILNITPMCKWCCARFLGYKYANYTLKVNNMDSTLAY